MKTFNKTMILIIFFVMITSIVFAIENNFYSIKGSFDEFIPYNIEDYEEAIKFSEEFLDKCSMELGVDLCLVNVKKNYKQIYLGECGGSNQVKKEGRVYFFCYDSYYDLKFGITVPELKLGVKTI